LEEVILDECGAWIKASIREVDLQSFVRTTPINKNEAMRHRVRKFRTNRDKSRIHLLAVKRNLTKRHRGIDRMRVPGLAVRGVAAGD